MDIMQRLAKNQWQLMKYGMIMGAVGGVFSFIGPLHSGLHNALLGVAVGGMFLGRRLKDAMKEVVKASNELGDEFLDE